MRHKKRSNLTLKVMVLSSFEKDTVQVQAFTVGMSYPFHLKFSKSTVSLSALPEDDLSVTRNFVMNPGYPEHSRSNRSLEWKIFI